MVSILGYSINEELYNGSRTLVYRATQENNQKSVVIKLLKNPYPSFNELLQFRNQYTIAKNLNLSGIVRPYSLEPYRNSYVLVMEDFGGVSLTEYIQTEYVTSLLDVLLIAVQITDILHNLHQNRVVHKDIKPANILIHPETKQVKLIDFSIASLLPKETQEIKNPNILEGTLAYISPEQTGRMNRGIDYRSDFYALGVTFFEILTQQLPFISDDPMELVHCHIAQQPAWVSEIEPEIPKVISEIIDKLMAKNAEDRYQSALGLKHDLEICFEQLKDTGEIKYFEIGQRDLCDRFLIPEKLYGREGEVQVLLDAFDRAADGKTEMILVAGFSGIGKTAIVNEVHKPIVRQRGYFIKGKFDQFNRNIPFSAFVQAFRDLMGQLLSEGDSQLARWKTRILDAIGENAQVIIEVIPELEGIIGTQPAVPELSGNAAQNRFNHLFPQFIQVFTTPEHPLVIFLDDLQWADSASLNLMKLLMGGVKTGYLLLIGAYRDNEVFRAHPLMLAVEDINKTEAAVKTLTLTPLSQVDINQIIADTLSCTVEIATPLTELVYQKTKGNPFFTAQFIKGLYEDGWITFNPQFGHWECDIVQVRQLSLTDDVVQLVAQQLQKLPSDTQTVLKLAACIGNQFDLNTLAIVSERSLEKTATDLWKALQDGLVLPISEVYKFYQTDGITTQKQPPERETHSCVYRFLHDRVQQAAYSLIPEEQKQATHLHMGQLLLQNLSPEQQDTNIFTIVNHWNQAIESIAADTTQREKLIQLNLSAGQKAKGSAAYEAAIKYFQTALSLFDSQSWQTNYPLALKLHEANVEAAYLTGDFEWMETNIDLVLEHSKSLLDRVKVHEIKIRVHMAQNQQLSALNTGIEFLELLGIEIPKSVQIEDLQREIAAISQLMTNKTIADLEHLPLMEDENQLAKVKILTNLLPPCYQTSPSLFPWVVCKLMQLLIKYGNTPQSAFTYGCYGLVCIFALQDFVSARKYGELACQLDLSPETGDGVSGIFAAGAALTHCSQHVKETLPLLLNAYQAGLETGNFQYGGYALSGWSRYLYFMGHDLCTLKVEMVAVSHALIDLKQGNTLLWNQAFEQGVLNLLGESEVSWKLVGTAYDENHFLEPQIAANDRTGLHYTYLNKLILCYLFGHIAQAVENAVLAESYLDGVICFLEEYVCNFYGSLTRLAHYDCAEPDVQQKILQKVDANQIIMQRWATHAPMNGEHKYNLVAAERHRVLGERFEAIELYDRAISGAKANEYISEEALSNELAAKFYLDWGKEKVAAGYMQEAYYCYARWGAQAKTDDLENRYPNLLQPILLQAASTLNPLETLAHITAPNISIHASTKNSPSSSTSINRALDFGTVLKASQALFGTIKLDELLRQLTRIILQNSGGDRCTLILPNQNGAWYVEAIATSQTTELCSEPLEGNSKLPVKLIQYVKNTQQVVAIDDLDTDLPVIDEYLSLQQPKSILCLPLVNQGNLIGIVYLKNRFTSGVFTSDRILIINFLCTQAAISLENAHLYQQAQAYAQQLEQSQLQMVQNEKMASLGNLVAGVAHEINNPIGFLNGSINNAKDYVQELLAHLELYQQHYPNAATPIQDHAEDIDLEFLSEDLPKLLDSMKGATSRIKSISTSLRTFSRADTDHKVRANLHEGLDSTLLILKYRLKANEHRPAIFINKEYGEIPEIECFPGQLNQVFMNILANAIDMFDEMAQNLTFAQIQASPQQITIRTEAIADRTCIRIRDNGQGMSEEVQAKVFDNLFTTKSASKGTGLGLAIARQIVEEKHGGSLTCKSVLGSGTEFTTTIGRTVALSERSIQLYNHSSVKLNNIAAK